MFGQSYTVFRVFGLDIKVNVGWAFLAILIAWSLAQGYFPGLYEGLPRQTYWWMGLAGAIGLFASITLHELAHSLVARSFGMEIRGITLWLLGGAAELADEPPSPKAEFFMAIVGPLTSAALAIALLQIGELLTSLDAPEPVTGVLSYLGLLNGILAVFNLVPAFPLDGGRVLRSMLWAWSKDLRWATWWASKTGSILGLTGIGFGLLTMISGSLVPGLWWILLGMFVRFAADSSYYQLEAGRTLAGKTVGTLMTADPVTVAPDMTIETLVNDWIYRHHIEFFPVLEDGRLVGCVSTSEVKRVPNDKWKETIVGDIMAASGPQNTVDADADAAEALEKMQRSGTSRLLVVRSGTLAGVITLKDLLKLIALKMDLERLGNHAPRRQGLNPV